MEFRPESLVGLETFHSSLASNFLNSCSQNKSTKPHMSHLQLGILSQRGSLLYLSQQGFLGKQLRCLKLGVALRWESNFESLSRFGSPRIPLRLQPQNWESISMSESILRIPENPNPCPCTCRESLWKKSMRIPRRSQPQHLGVHVNGGTTFGPRD